LRRGPTKIAIIVLSYAPEVKLHERKHTCILGGSPPRSLEIFGSTPTEHSIYSGWRE